MLIRSSGNTYISVLFQEIYHPAEINRPAHKKLILLDDGGSVCRHRQHPACFLEKGKKTDGIPVMLFMWGGRTRNRRKGTNGIYPPLKQLIDNNVRDFSRRYTGPAEARYQVPASGVSAHGVRRGEHTEPGGLWIPMIRGCWLSPFRGAGGFRGCGAIRERNQNYKQVLQQSLDSRRREAGMCDNDMGQESVS